MVHNNVPYKRCQIRFRHLCVDIRLTDEPRDSPVRVTSLCNQPRHSGFLPNNAKCRLLEISTSAPVCDCCTEVPDTTQWTYSFLKNAEFDDDRIHFMLHLMDEPLIINDTDICINGKFYQKPNTCGLNRGSKLSTFPYLDSKFEKDLIAGYLRQHFDEFYEIPDDVWNVVCTLYPQCWGVSYAVTEHNRGINSMLKPRTKQFTIGGSKGIGLHLQYTSDASSRPDADAHDLALLFRNDDNRPYLMVDFSDNPGIFQITLLVNVTCTITMQSYTFIKNVENEDEQLVAINCPDFGPASTLESLQIRAEALTVLSDTLYIYPLRLKQSDFFIEWNISSDVLRTALKNMSVHRCYCESEWFYDMFVLRFSPNYDDHVLLGLQCLAIPYDSKQDINVLCTRVLIIEVATNTTCEPFTHTFSYEDHRDTYRGYKVMKNEKIIECETLTFRVVITVIDEDAQENEADDEDDE
jgi:hypothetical protein